jgi:hypothetical protein
VWQWLSNVERLGVRDGGDRYQPNVLGCGRDAGRHQHGVGTAGQATGVDLFTPAGCGVSVSSTVRKSGRPRSAVAARSAQCRPLVTGSASVCPRLGMPAVSVERDAEMQVLAHRSVFANATG